MKCLRQISTVLKGGRSLTKEIHDHFVGPHLNFDLTDCDRMLRVDCNAEHFYSQQFINWLCAGGCAAEILPDH